MLFRSNFDIHFNPNMFDHFDVCFRSFNNPVLKNYAEIKVRSEKYTVNNLSGSTILEKVKLDYFIKLHQLEPDSKFWYINFFSNGILIFDLTNRIINKDWMIEQNEYRSNNSESYYSTKSVCFLAFNDKKNKDWLIVDELSL